jgi:DNA repair protein RecO (recombination protein O)
MALGKTAAVVIGSFPLGESDRVVTFYSREFGKLRGVAKAARRMRSRFSGSLELFTLGQLVFFDAGRSDLVRIDHFDVTEPFAGLRDDLERLGHASWVVECVARLTADRDRQAALYGLLLRALRAMQGPTRPGRVAVCFAGRLLDVLGQRPRLDQCGDCGRRYPFPRARFHEGGLLCEACGAHAAGADAISGAAVAVFDRLRSLRWDEAMAAPVGRAEPEVRAVLESHMSRLIGQPTRTTKFMREVRRLSTISGERP